jgi:hypothetical protein
LTIILQAIKLVICAIVAVYLGRKLIRKPPPMPSAYDAAAFEQSPVGRKRLRAVKLVITAILLGTPIVTAVLVLGLMYLSKSALSPAEIHWSQLGMPSIMLAANAMLYLMSSGVVLKTYPWKWLVLAMMLIGSVVVAPAIPYPVAKAGSLPILDPLPPLMLFLGLMWFLSGAVTLFLFMRHNPLPVTDAP